MDNTWLSVVSSAETHSLFSATNLPAPSAPRNLIGRLLPPATGSSPKVNLTWERPAEENGFVRKYLLYVSDNETSNGARLQLDPSDCWYLMSVYGRTSYTFRLSGFTIKEGPKTTVQQFVIPEYGEINYLLPRCASEFHTQLIAFSPPGRGELYICSARQARNCAYFLY